MRKFKALLLLISVLAFVAVSAVHSFAGPEGWDPNQSPAALVSSDAAGNYEVSGVRWGFADQNSFKDPYFRTIRFNANDVSAIYFATLPFPPSWLLTHSSMIFEFKKPVVTDKNATSYAIMLSIEPRLKKGQYCDLIFKGTAGGYPIIYQLSSIEDYMHYALDGIGTGGLGGKNALVKAVMKRKKLYSYKLKLDRDAEIKLLKCAIDAAVADRSGEKYETLHNSCTNNLFVLINRVLPGERRYNEKVVRGVVFSHLIVKRLLNSHGLIDMSMPVVRNGQEKDLPFGETAGKAVSSISGGGPAAISEMLSGIKVSLEKAILAGDIDKVAILDALYDGGTRHVPALYIPGAVPESDNGSPSGEFILGEEFVAGINRASGDRKSLADYVSKALDAYEKGLKERLSMDGPDVFSAIYSKIFDLKRTTERAIGYSRLRKMR